MRSHFYLRHDSLSTISPGFFGLGATGLLQLARSLPASATSLCPALVRIATQYRQIRSLIQTEAQTYRILPLIPNTTSTFLVQQASGDVRKIAV
jgi:hypothetical protein